MLPIVLALGCGRIDFDPVGGSANPTPDAPPPPQRWYIKASNTGANDQFGSGIALSADGMTLAVSAQGEASAARGIDGDQNDDSAAGAGAVYVFTRIGTTWTQQAYLKASNAEAGDRFGGHICLSADGSTLAVGAEDEASAATGVNGNQADNSASRSGAVYVFARTGTSWEQQAYIKASNTETTDLFGYRFALSRDGATLVVGSTKEDSAATGINGNQASNTASTAGAAYVYVRTGSTWSQQAYLKASNTDAGDDYGGGVGVSADGSTIAVGATFEDSAATGINGNQASNTFEKAGAVYVYTRSGGVWSQQAYVKASNTGAGDWFGASLSLSSDGSTLAVAAWLESGGAPGVNGDQTSDAAAGAGAVYVFTRSGIVWSQQAYLKASNPGPLDSFGIDLVLTPDGSRLVVGARFEDSDATGLDGDDTNDAATSAGAAYVFDRSGATWSARGYVKAYNTGADDELGTSVAVSADGELIAVGAPGEASAATGIDGDMDDDSLPNAGAAYVFTLDDL